MKKSSSLFLLLGLFFLSNASASLAQGKADGDFEIVPLLSQNPLDPGETAIVQVYFQGTGPIHRPILHGIIPIEILTPGRNSIKVEHILLSKVLTHPTILWRNDFLESPLVVELMEKLFMTEDSSNNPVLLGENNFKRIGDTPENDTWSAPLVFKFVLPLTSPPGEHPMVFRLFYETNGITKVSSYVFNLRVTSWSERNRAWLTALLGLLFFLAGSIDKLGLGVSGFKIDTVHVSWKPVIWGICVVMAAVIIYVLMET